MVPVLHWSAGLVKPLGGFITSMLLLHFLLRKKRTLAPLVFVTGNTIKITRLRDALAGIGFVSVESIDLGTTEIQASTVREVAEDKALKAFKSLKRPLVVHDVGLWVNALEGFPGPYTAYAAKTIGLQGLLAALDSRNGADRSCSWRECLAYVDAQGIVHMFEATIPGSLATVASNSKGCAHSTRRLVGTFGAAFVPSWMSKPLCAMNDDEFQAYDDTRPSSFKMFAEWWEEFGLPNH